MSEMIQERRTSEKIERFDLFSSLLEASNEDETGAGLTESELIGIYNAINLDFRTAYGVLGNIFIFLVAGHEVRRFGQRGHTVTHSLQTTAHTLAFTFALLALYQDEQETLYQHIKSVLTDRRIPVGIKLSRPFCRLNRSSTPLLQTYEDMSHLTHSMA